MQHRCYGFCHTSHGFGLCNTHYNTKQLTLQDTATHCNTLQNTATHCNTMNTPHCNTGAMAFCPTSNLFLGSGLADLQAVHDRGIRCGLGTDIGGNFHFSFELTHILTYSCRELICVCRRSLRTNVCGNFFFFLIHTHTHICTSKMHVFIEVWSWYR